MKQTQMYVCTFTALKQSLRRLCFYTGLSVILFTGGSTWAGKSPLGRNTPRQVHPLAGTLSQVGTPWQVPPSRYTPGQVHPSQAGTLPRAGTPPAGTAPLVGTPPRQVHPAPPGQVPLWQVPPCRYTPRHVFPLCQCMLEYGQQAGSTHPTGMHSCSSRCSHIAIQG